MTHKLLSEMQINSFVCACGCEREDNKEAAIKFGGKVNERGTEWKETNDICDKNGNIEVKLAMKISLESIDRINVARISQ